MSGVNFNGLRASITREFNRVERSLAVNIDADGYLSLDRRETQDVAKRLDDLRTDLAWLNALMSGCANCGPYEHLENPRLNDVSFLAED